MPADAKRIVRKVTQSPMNARIWMLDLECGHEVLIVQSKRPATESIKRDRATGEMLCGPRRVLCPRCDR